MTELPDLSKLSNAEKDALIRLLWQRLEKLECEISELWERLGAPAKTPDNSSIPPSKGQKAATPEKPRRKGCGAAAWVTKAAAGH